MKDRIVYKLINGLINLQLKVSGLKYYEALLPNFKICFWDSGGDLPAILMLQAFTAEAKYTWRKQIKSLVKKHRIILPNLVYFGDSISKSPVYSVAEQVNAMEELLAHLHIDSYYLLGASYGGVISAELALSNIEKVKKMVLLGPPLKFLTEEDKKQVYKKFNVSGRIELLVPDNYKRLAPLMALAYKFPPKIPSFIFKSLYTQLYQKQASERRKLLAHFSIEEVHYNNKDYKFQIPVLLIWGGEDKMIPVRVAKELVTHMGNNAELRIINETSHLPNLEKSDVFNQHILNFFR